MNLETINSESTKSNEISIKEVVFKIQEWYRYLLSKWLIILVFGIIGGVAGFSYAYFKKTVYTATTTFVLEEGGPGGALGNLGGLASMVGIDVGGGGGIFQGDNILELYKSRKMIQKTLLTEVDYNGKKLLLIDRYIDFNKLKEEWSKNSKLKDIHFNKLKTMHSAPDLGRLQDSILGTIVNDINKSYLKVAKPDKKLSIIKADVKSIDEFFAKAFNDQIVKNVNDFYLQTKTKKSLENVIILQQKTDSVRSVLNGAIYSAAVVSDATPNLNPTRQVQRIVPMQRSQFTAETNKAVLTELVKNLELSRMALRKETPLIQVLDEPIFPLDSEKIGKSKAIIIGGIIGGVIICLILIFRRLFKGILD